MNVRESAARLSDSIYRLIAASPAVQALSDRGLPLEDILSSREWTSRWLANADADSARLLRAIVLRYASLPFELEQLEKALAQDGFTGAEVRVGIAKLRREGVLFAVRKAWGDRVYYVPTDAIALWQPLLMPVRFEPLPPHALWRPIYAEKPYRLPLSLELLIAWHTMRDYPIGITAKGSLNRSAIARIVMRMRLTPEELVPLAFAYPDSEYLPRQAALAIDMGMCAGVLIRTRDAIRLEEGGLRRWLAKSVRQADARLLALLVERYASSNARLHLIASACRGIITDCWLSEQCFASVAEGGEADAWLGLLESCGWLERGTVAGERVFRAKPEYPRDEPGVSDCMEQGGGSFVVQPDGEIIVTPDVGLSARWTLEDVAELVAADTLFVYRLTRRACAEAYAAGYTLDALRGFLEQGSGDRLPDQAADALSDWYSRLGMARLVEALLLRAATPELAKLLREDPELSLLTIEPIGATDFIVDPADRRVFEERLAKLGYPLTKRGRSDVERKAGDEPRPIADGGDPGWIYQPRTVRHYEAEASLPDPEELFPGVSDIPAAWLREPRSYHASTREALLRRAIDWQAPVLVRQAGGLRQFVPSAVERAGTDWYAIGHWREEGSCMIPEKVEGGAFAEVMILLPELDGV